MATTRLRCGGCQIVHIIAEGQQGTPGYVHTWNLCCGKKVWNDRAGRTPMKLLEKGKPTCIACIANGGL